MIQEKILLLRGPNAPYATNCNNADGAFWIPTAYSDGYEPIGLYHCRESFHDYWEGHVRKEQMVGFSVKGKIDIEKIDKFLSWIAAILGCGPFEVYPTSEPNSIIVKVPEFWMAYRLRKGLFTMFLRCSHYHFKGGDDYAGALLEYPLTGGMIMMIGHFLSGYTAPSGIDDYHVWRTHYSFCSAPHQIKAENGRVEIPPDHEISKILKKP